MIQKRQRKKIHTRGQLRVAATAFSSSLSFEQERATPPTFFFPFPKDILATQNPSDLPVMVAMYLNTAYLLAALLALFARGRSNAFQYFTETICIFLLMHAEDLSREKLQIF